MNWIDATEIWSPIPGHRGYEASIGGRIRNAETGHVLRPYAVVNDWGYPRLTVCLPGRKNGRGSRRVAVSRLVCAAFDRKPRKGEMCRHLDGDPMNNSAGNLKWGSRQENADDGPGKKYTAEEIDAVIDAVFGRSEAA